MTPHTQGFLLTLFGVLILTPDTLLVRLVDTDPWTMTAWRGLLSGPAIIAAFFLVRRSAAFAEIRDMGGAGISIMLLHAINAICFVVALHYTSVANTLVILATMPLIAALLSFVMLREQVAVPTWCAIIGGFTGIIIVVADGLGRGTAFGDLNAFITAFTLALSFVIIRQRRDVNMVPAAGAGAFLSGLLVLPFAQLLSVSGPQIPLLLIMCLGVLPIAFGLLILGPRTLPAPEVALLLLLETVLGPIWVWMGVGEEPTQAALLGGGIVVTTLVLHSLWRLRQLSSQCPS